MGSMSVSSCRWSIFVSCVHPVAVLNTAFCMTCSLLMLPEDARGVHVEETYSRATITAITIQITQITTVLTICIITIIVI